MGICTRSKSASVLNIMYNLEPSISLNTQTRDNNNWNNIVQNMSITNVQKQINMMKRLTCAMLYGCSCMNVQGLTCALCSQNSKLSSIHFGQKHDNSWSFNKVISTSSTKANECMDQDPSIILQSQLALQSTSFGMIKWKYQWTSHLAFGYVACSLPWFFLQNATTSLAFWNFDGSIFNCSFRISCSILPQPHHELPFHGLNRWPYHAAPMRKCLGCDYLWLIPMKSNHHKMLALHDELWNNFIKKIESSMMKCIHTMQHGTMIIFLNCVAHPLDQTRCLFGQLPFVVKWAQCSSK
jgi:hypothetical protein